MSFGWILVVVHLVLSVPMWRLLRPVEPAPHERIAPWATEEWEVRRNARLGAANLVWGLGGLVLIGLALFGVW